MKNSTRFLILIGFLAASLLGGLVAIKLLPTLVEAEAKGPICNDVVPCVDSSQLAAYPAPKSVNTTEFTPPGSDAVDVPVSAPVAGPVASGTPVYFTPQDGVGSGTVLFLYNTSSTPTTVVITGYAADGTVGATWSVPLAAHEFRRLVSDPVGETAAASWLNPPPFSVDFTDLMTYASMSLPPGVKADGYVVYNGEDDVIDPDQDQQALPLRFSADPITVYLPTVLQ